MTTTQRGKPGGKSSQRARKPEPKRQKPEQPAELKADQPGRNQMAETVVPTEDIGVVNEAALLAALTEEETVGSAAAVAPSAAPLEDETAKQASETALSGDVLAPESHVVETPPTTKAVALQTIAEAYADYTRNSWAARRLMVDRVMKTRSFSEALEVQGDFAKQACANFVEHSQRIGALYAEFTRQFFQPLEKLATGWTRVGR